MAGLRSAPLLIWVKPSSALHARLWHSHPVPLDLLHGAQLFQAQCATCHGPQGRGDGPLALSLDPKPTALADHLRARGRSLLALHQIITSSVSGTPMASFGALPEDDRWALAFFVGTLPYAESDAATGTKLWQSSAQARQAMPDLDTLTQTSEHALADRLDGASARSLTAYLRANPKALAANKPGGTAIAKATFVLNTRSTTPRVTTNA